MKRREVITSPAAGADLRRIYAVIADAGRHCGPAARSPARGIGRRGASVGARATIQPFHLPSGKIAGIAVPHRQIRLYITNSPDAIQAERCR